MHCVFCHCSMKFYLNKMNYYRALHGVNNFLSLSRPRDINSMSKIHLIWKVQKVFKI